MAKRKSTPIQHGEVVTRFAASLRAARRTRGMTQRELAERAELTETYISRLESAGAAPGIDLVGRLADALGVSTHDLLPDPAPPDTRQVLLEQARRLFDAVTGSATDDALVLLNQFLAMMAESTAKGR